MIVIGGNVGGRGVFMRMGPSIRLHSIWQSDMIFRDCRIGDLMASIRHPRHKTKRGNRMIVLLSALFHSSRPFWGTEEVFPVSGAFTKVSAYIGSIAIGDPLTVLYQAFMKATKPGMIAGYALEAVSATGTIEVFIRRLMPVPYCGRTVRAGNG